MADGNLNFDTKLDQKGFVKGIKHYFGHYRPCRNNKGSHRQSNSVIQQNNGGIRHADRSRSTAFGNNEKLHIGYKRANTVR